MIVVRVDREASRATIIMSVEDLLELREQMICTPGLARHPKTALEHLAIKITKQADLIDPPVKE